MRKLFQARPRSPFEIAGLYTIVILLGVLLLQICSRSFGPHQPACRAPGATYTKTITSLGFVAWALSWCLAFITVLAAYLLVRLSIRTLRTGTFPPPGTRTLRPLPVLVGEAAHRRAISGLVFAGVLLVFAVLLPLVMTTLAQRLLSV